MEEKQLDTQYLDGFINELLHINEGGKNKLIDLGANGGKNTYLLDHLSAESLSRYTIGVIRRRRGKDANTVLVGSAKADKEIYVGSGEANSFTWKDYAGGHSPSALNSFIDSVYRDMALRGNNPLFLSVGAIRWRIIVQKELKEIATPLLIVPVRLVRTSSTQPVTIEFTDDDIYLNPCLDARLRREFAASVADGFPLPNGLGSDRDEPVNLEELAKDGGDNYFKSVGDYVASCTSGYEASKDALFTFDKDVVAISEYRHDELCTYYDIRRNKQKIYSDPLVGRVFNTGAAYSGKPNITEMPKLVLPSDSVQEDMITRVVNGQSLIIEGPPGTGKTLTIANMISSLLASGKSVMFMSKKISALTEVNAKLPDKLRKFVLLLEGETEKQAASLSPKNIKINFRQLVQWRNEYSSPRNLRTDMDSSRREMQAANTGLRKYLDVMFRADVIAGDSLYSALDGFCLNENAPLVEFCNGAEALKLDREAFNAVLARAESAQSRYDVITANSTHSALKCPWYGMTESCDVNRAIADGEAIANTLLTALSDADRAIGGAVSFDELQLSTLIGLTDCVLDEEQISTFVLNGSLADECTNIENRLRAYLKVKDTAAMERYPVKDREGLTDDVVFLVNAKTDRDLTIDKINKLAKNKEVFYTASGNFLTDAIIEKLVKIIESTAKLNEEKRAAYDRACGFFDRDKLDAEACDFIIKNRAVFAQYEGKDAQAPKTFDFKGKKAYERLAPLSFLQPVKFSDMVVAVSEFCRSNDIQQQINSDISLIHSVMTRKLSDEQIEALIIALSGRHKSEEVKSYVTFAAKESEKIGALAAEVSADGNCKLGDIISAYDSGACMIWLKQSLEKVKEQLKIEQADDEKLARSVVALRQFAAASAAKFLPADKIAEIVCSLKSVKTTVGAALEKTGQLLWDFGKNNFVNVYTYDPWGSDIKDLKIFAREICDRSVLASVRDYNALKKGGEEELSLVKFFEPFERDCNYLPEGMTFKEALAHSLYGICIKAVLSLTGGTTLTPSADLEKYSRAEERLLSYNVDAIEQRCAESFDGGDPLFAFIHSESGSDNLRKIFKKHGAAIMKLKKCIILSPYTVSLLFSTSEYEKFDVVIIDEASQIEPALILSGLFRAKQCVIVGDEFQMPPIKHFEEQMQKVGNPANEDSFESLEPEISALSLALKHNAFHITELICHYRSLTESLISYSQSQFYPTMRTFPSIVPRIEPKKGVKGLGINDIYLPGGCTASGGVNPAEADKVVEELNAHFNNYFDEQTGKLSMSVGVVAFGLSQIEAINSRVKKDKQLYEKISTALANFDDVKEKLIFFKAIEQVQGQETEHLILSLTYGKNERGIYQHFGQLNQGKLGKNIFNVAVTRAQSMITVIHSIRSSEITNESIKYIGDYLAMAERFSRPGKTQFVCAEQPSGGFTKQVADYIVSTGIDRERVVFDYGVTEGSVRIPVAVLSKELDRAILGIWCERPTGRKFNYIDYNLRYPASLRARGWTLHRINICDWVYNGRREREQLSKQLEQAEKINKTED